MNSFKNRTLGLLCSVLILGSTSGLADDTFKKSTTLDALVAIDGAQALVAVVQVVDEEGTLPFKLADLLADKNTKTILFAPSNSAFESLLGLDPGTLDGLSIGTIRELLLSGNVPLPEGVTLEDVQQILLQHASRPDKFKKKTASIGALIQQGSVEMADGDELPVGIGGSGGRINYEASVTASDVYTKNGVIHFLDAVIVNDALDD